MIRIYAFVEGSTEEKFMQDVMCEYFLQLNICIVPIQLSTSSSQKGGISNYEKIRRQIERKCKEDKNAWVTTMIDYYALPRDFPKISKMCFSNPIECVSFLEKSFREEISLPNFIPNIILHEFEAILFCQPSVFEFWGFENQGIDKLNQIKAEFETPEYINNSRETAPSKRIIKIFPSFQKPLHGPGIASLIGLEAIRKECAHFDQWVTKLEKIKERPFM